MKKSILSGIMFATVLLSAGASTTAMAATTNQNVISSTASSFQLPHGVTLDPSITPLASSTASSQAKFNAILSVAQSKLGTLYEWGHNEDRGQYGFDCSNFVEYVFHHALGYKFSTSSITQYQSVGTRVSISNMQPGDLLSFNNGGHSGIYIGNGQMIQCGGGLGKVGYLKVAPGSYWYKHISAVKSMY
jgi:cell wall-associated NlpC family hydrolase